MSKQLPSGGCFVILFRFGYNAVNFQLQQLFFQISRKHFCKEIGLEI
jgi:hypothetical protein